MSDSLAVYLNDHLAGAKFAVELLESLRDHHKHASLGKFAAEVLEEVKKDQDLLEELIDRAGAGSTLKEAAAWMGHQASRWKVGGCTDTLGIFQALEALSLGVLGKRALWLALAEIAPVDSRLGEVKFDQLIQRAEAQFVRLEEERIAAARAALVDARSRGR